MRISLSYFFLCYFTLIKSFDWKNLLFEIEVQNLLYVNFVDIDFNIKRAPITHSARASNLILIKKALLFPLSFLHMCKIWNSNALLLVWN